MRSACACTVRQLFALKNESCKLLCEADYGFKQIKGFVSRIRKDFNVNWCVRVYVWGPAAGGVELRQNLASRVAAS